MIKEQRKNKEENNMQEKAIHMPDVELKELEREYKRNEENYME